MIVRRVLSKLLFHPTTLLPFVGGLSVAIIGFGLSSIPLIFFGVSSCLLGGAATTTRAIFNLNDIVTSVYRDIDKEEEDKREQLLDELDGKLCRDRDPRPETCLRQLRSFNELIKNNPSFHLQISGEFERLFNICVKKIDETHRIWLDYRVARGKNKEFLKLQREKIVVEIEATTSQLSTMMEQFQSIGDAKNEVELTQARQEFEQSLEIAKKVQQRMSNLDDAGYDSKTFEQEN